MLVERLRAVGSIAAIVIFTASCGSSSPTPVPPSGQPAAPSGSAAAVATSAPTQPLPSPTPRPSGPAPDGSWTGLDLPPVPEVAQLTADLSGAAGADPATTFTLHSLAATSAASLATGLSARPAIAWTVEPGADPATVRIRPSAGLARGAAYRFTLLAPDGSTAGEWTFRTAGPPRVAGTIPGDEATDVPVDRAIEITFDRDGVADPTGWFSIQPATKGRMEQHGRAWVFVPDALRPGTLYTVTLRPGVPLTGSDQVTEAATRFRFATGSTASTPGTSIQVGRTVVESAPGAHPVLGVTLDTWGDDDPPTSLKLTIRRLPGLDAAVAAARAIADRATWTSTAPPAVATTGLPVVATTKTPLVVDPEEPGLATLRLPDGLEAGWYLVDLPRPVATGQQVLLQVTPLAGYAASAPDRTVVWADRVGGAGAAGATVRLADGPTLGTTDADGLLVTDTPAAMYAPTPDGSVRRPIVVVEAPDAGSLVLPLGFDSGGLYRSETWNPSAGRGTTRWASTLDTDRSTYRRTDSIAAWGIVRDLRTDAVPPALSLTLTAADGGGSGTASLPIASTDLIPTPAGVFDGTLSFDGIPSGSYDVTLAAGDQRVASTRIDVDVIRKPAYRLSVAIDHRAAYVGDPMRATVTATFYDGTPVVDLPLSVAVPTPDDGEEAPLLTATTGPDGTATVRFKAADSGWVMAFTSSPELGDVQSPPVEIAVLPGSAFVEFSTATRTGRNAQATGRVSTVDLARIESALAAGRSWNEDVGPARAGATVSVDVVGETWVQVRTGTEYDPVQKKSVPTYEWQEQDVDLGTVTAKSDAEGRFTVKAKVPAAVAAKDPSVAFTATVRDGQGRDATGRMTTFGTGGSPEADVIWLDPAAAGRSGQDAVVCGGTDAYYALGETVRLTMRDRKGPLPASGSTRYLFLQDQDGIQAATVSGSPVFTRTFDRAAVPGVTVSAVAWDGATFRRTTSTVRAIIDPASRALDVRITSDQPAGSSFTPGATARLTITTRDASGRPVPSDVVLRGVDQKLYDAGIASDGDPLTAIYAPGYSGVTATWASHPDPGAQYLPGCGGSTGGGGAGAGLRSDFRDRAFFLRGRTGADGTMSVPVALPDDLTEWHVAAMGVSDDLHVGTGTDGVTVGLPFFVAPVLPDTVLASDRPSLVLRAYGSALKRGDPITYTVKMPQLGIPEVSREATAFQTPVLALPPLTLGTHPITVMATAHTASGDLTDAMVVQLEVVASREGVLRTAVAPVRAGEAPPGGTDSLTTCTFADAGRASLAPLLDSLAAGSGPRVDQAASAAQASSLLASSFGRDPSTDAAASFDPAPYLLWEDGSGVSLVPDGSKDLDMTTLAILGAPGLFPTPSLAGALADIANDRSQTRERRIVALAGLAAAGEPVAEDLRAAGAAPDLSLLEQAWIAVGLGEAGDLAGAREVERKLLAASGERSGGWARVRAATPHESVAATALLAVAAARIGDPLAPDLADFVAGQTDPEAIHPFEQVAYAARALARMPRTAASLRWTLGEKHETADLAADGPVSLTLTPDQRAAILLQPLTGDVTAACSWTAAAAAADLPSDPSVRLTRSVTPSGPLPAGTLVTVDLAVAFGAQAPSGEYGIVETLPAGLAPVDWQPQWTEPTDETEETATPPIAPWSIRGNTVRWAVGWDPATPASASAHLRTVARVVAPGTYTWEPAIVQAATAPSIGSTVAPTTVTIVMP